MTWDPVAQKELNDKHRLDPKPGDVWEDHMVHVCIVLDVSDTSVLICRKKKDLGPSSWTWDLSKMQWITRTEMAGVFLYHRPPQTLGGASCWANVMPGNAIKYVERWKATTVATQSPNRDNYR